MARWTSSTIEGLLLDDASERLHDTLVQLPQLAAALAVS